MKLLVIYEENINPAYVEVMKINPLDFEEIRLVPMKPISKEFSEWIDTHEHKIMKKDIAIENPDNFDPYAERDHILLDEWGAWTTNQLRERMFAYMARNNLFGYWPAYLVDNQISTEIFAYREEGVPNHQKRLKKKEKLENLLKFGRWTEIEEKILVDGSKEPAFKGYKQLDEEEKIRVQAELDKTIEHLKRSRPTRVKKIHKTATVFALMSNFQVIISTHNLTPEQLEKVWKHEWLHTIIDVQQTHFQNGHCINSAVDIKTGTPTAYNCLMAELVDTSSIDLALGLCELCGGIVDEEAIDKSIYYNITSSPEFPV